MVLQWQCQVIVVIKFLSNVYSIDYSTILISIDIIMILISISSFILLFRTILNRLIFHFTCLNKFSKFRLLFSSNQIFFWLFKDVLLSKQTKRTPMDYTICKSHSLNSRNSMKPVWFFCFWKSIYLYTKRYVDPRALPTSVFSDLVELRNKLTN